MMERINGQGAVSPVIKQRAAQRVYGAEPVAASSDEASISPFAKELGRIMGELDKIPDVRQEKIEGFKRQIAEGTYHPDLAKVAGSLLMVGFLNGEE